MEKTELGPICKEDSNGRFFDVAAIMERNLIMCAYRRTKFSNGNGMLETRHDTQPWYHGDKLLIMILPSTGSVYGVRHENKQQSPKKNQIYLEVSVSE